MRAYECAVITRLWPRAFTLKKNSLYLLRCAKSFSENRANFNALASYRERYVRQLTKVLSYMPIVRPLIMTRSILSFDETDMSATIQKISPQKVKKQAEQEQAKESLRQLLAKANYTVYTDVKHVSRSGMSRIIESYITIDNQIETLPPYLLDNAGFYVKRAKNGEGWNMGGCGMDMGFALVYDISQFLYPQGFDCLGEYPQCPGTDHVNHVVPMPKHHDSGGYRLRQKWL